MRTAATQRAPEELQTQQNRLNRQRRALLWSQRTGSSPDEYQTSNDEDVGPAPRDSAADLYAEEVENPDRQHHVKQDAAYAHELHEQEQQVAQQ